MNHRIFGKQLGRNHHQRQALIKSLSRSMFTYGSIETTQAKAKAVISTVEKLANSITTKNVVLAQRELSKYFQDRNFVKNVYDTFKTTFGDQTSNFTKFWKVKFRQGDDALIVKLAFVKPYTLKKVEPVKEEVKAKAKPVKKVISQKNEK